MLSPGGTTVVFQQLSFALPVPPFEFRLGLFERANIEAPGRG